MNAIVAAVGIVVLLCMAVGIGMSMDTEAQRRAARELARERRLAAQRRDVRAAPRCADCPFWWQPDDDG